MKPSKASESPVTTIEDRIRNLYDSAKAETTTGMTHGENLNVIAGSLGPYLEIGRSND